MSKSPCDNCERVCASDGRGCDAWRHWFVKNWNENICRKPSEPQEEELFRYEHPDAGRNVP